jgi:hypothetical protein
MSWMQRILEIMEETGCASEEAQQRAWQERQAARAAQDQKPPQKAAEAAA